MSLGEENSIPQSPNDGIEWMNQTSDFEFAPPPMDSPFASPEPHSPDFSFDPPSPFSLFAPDSPVNFQFPVSLPSPLHRRELSMPTKLPPPPEMPKLPTTSAESFMAPSSTGFAPVHQRNKTQPPMNLDNEAFNTICADKELKFNPHQLGFIPSKIWPDQEYTFGELVQDFFQRKNNANSRFSHKLYNALRIAEFDPFYVEFLGVSWVNHNVLKVNKNVFARLLGIKTIDGSLFHQQGNFPSHGFLALDPVTARKCTIGCDISDVDFENVRLLFHQQGIFVRGCTEKALEQCKWISTRRR